MEEQNIQQPSRSEREPTRQRRIAPVHQLTVGLSQATVQLTHVVAQHMANDFHAIVSRFEVSIDCEYTTVFLLELHSLVLRTTQNLLVN